MGIFKKPKNRVFQHFFVARRSLASLRSTLNYANLCTLPYREQFTSFFYYFVVKYPENCSFYGGKIGFLVFTKLSHYTYLLKVTATKQRPLQRLAALQKLWREPRGLCKALFVRRKKRVGVQDLTRRGLCTRGLRRFDAEGFRQTVAL